MIFTGQPIGLTATFTDETTGNIISVSGKTPSFDYFLPGNTSDTPNGTVSATFVAGVATGSIPANVNTLAGNMIVQAKINDGTNTYRAEKTNIYIYA